MQSDEWLFRAVLVNSVLYLVVWPNVPFPAPPLSHAWRSMNSSCSCPPRINGNERPGAVARRRSARMLWRGGGVVTWW